ncbi:MAG: sigma-70 family RNA polymerase sigma factor [Akkermansiaceae bacterium]|nr:sigma-70 family RNA polymerase sigma factor [Akkermansiaceae bacterium]MCP5549559.1 sigma-70 family RNA polymerase sigma factor [Akkermansiaceae bacterium]
MENGTQNAAAAETFISSVYGELRQVARWKMANEAPQTIGATALVHEAWMRVSERGEISEWKDRRAFFAAASEAMRRILIERARARATRKRGGNPVRVDLEAIEVPEEDRQIIAVGEALERFSQVDPEISELVKMKFFVGMTWEEIAAVTEIPERTLRRRWAYARSWLHEAIGKDSALFDQEDSSGPRDQA